MSDTFRPVRDSTLIFPLLPVLTWVLLTVIVTGMLILGGAAVVNALSGMDIYAASFLIPLAAAPFTMQGIFTSISQLDMS